MDEPLSPSRPCPQPRLWLGSVEFSAFEPRNGRMQRQVQHRAALAFGYDGQFVSGSITARGSAVARQPARERQLREVLQSFGFKLATRQSKALPESAGELYELAGDGAWLRFMQSELPRLRGEGWQIEYAENFAFDLMPVQGWYAAVEEANERDWFELELGIEVDGQRLSLLPILLNLLRLNPELLRPANVARRRDDEQLIVPLPGNNGAGPGRVRQVALPWGRLKPVVAALGDLYRLEGHEQRLRLATPDAPQLSALQALPLQWQGGEQLRELAQRLRAPLGDTQAPPQGLHATLRPYQLQGLAWMQNLRALGVGGVLADDMGLGKTLQTLAHVLCEKETGRLDRPAMVVMPTSLVPNWLDEAARFAPSLKVLALQGTGRKQHFADLHHYDLLLTTYALLPKDIEQIAGLQLHLLVLDEAQYIKTANTKAAQAARRFQARQRLCLSGTPLENHLGELWSLFHFLMPGWLGDAKGFTSTYRVPIERHADDQRLADLNRRIGPFLLRRTKDQVATELPPKTEIVHWVELNDAQRDVYETVRLALDHKVREEIRSKGMARSQIVILEALLKLRQVCCDLRLAGQAPAEGSASGKLDSLMDMLERLLSEGRRVLLFSQFTSMLALIERELQARQVSYALLTGATRDRSAPVKAFQQGELPVFLISLKAGGVGLNLTAADTVIHYDPWWNPAAEQQATDRAYRIGQNKPVFVYKLITRGTVEEKIAQLQREKAALAAGVLEGGQAGEWRWQAEDIEALFGG